MGDLLNKKSFYYLKDIVRVWFVLRIVTVQHVRIPIVYRLLLKPLVHCSSSAEIMYIKMLLNI